MKSLLAFCLVFGTNCDFTPVDTSSLLKQTYANQTVVSQTARDMLQEFKQDLDDLSARMGATSFGRAENIDPNLFRSIQCCTPEVPAFVPPPEGSENVTTTTF